MGYVCYERAGANYYVELIMSFNQLTLRPLPPLLVYAAFLVLVFAVGGAGGYATAPEIKGWYSTLVKPSFSPPNWLFGPVWTLLYIMIAIVGARLTLNSTAPSDARRQALIAFWLQLALNAAWSPVFFGLHAIGPALIVIGLMWLSIAATIGLAWRFDRVAAVMLVPYFGWVSFASLLNATLYRLN